MLYKYLFPVFIFSLRYWVWWLCLLYPLKSNKPAFPLLAFKGCLVKIFPVFKIIKYSKFFFLKGLRFSSLKVYDLGLWCTYSDNFSLLMLYFPS